MDILSPEMKAHFTKIRTALSKFEFDSLTMCGCHVDFNQAEAVINNNIIAVFSVYFIVFLFSNEILFIIYASGSDILNFD